MGIMRKKYWKGQCRWCGNGAKLNDHGRCEECERHYKKNRVRGAIFSMMVVTT